MIADQQGVLHRSRRDLERLDDESPHQQGDQQRNGKCLDVLAKLPFSAHFLSRTAGVVCRLPGHSLTFRMERKASWGISTVPTCFILFFPSFCFSSSFLFRAISPPQHFAMPLLLIALTASR